MEIQNKNEKSFFRPNGPSPRFGPRSQAGPAQLVLAHTRPHAPAVQWTGRTPLAPLLPCAVAQSCGRARRVDAPHRRPWAVARQPVGALAPGRECVQVRSRPCLNPRASPCFTSRLPFRKPATGVEHSATACRATSATGEPPPPDCPRATLTTSPLLWTSNRAIVFASVRLNRALPPPRSPWSPPLGSLRLRPLRPLSLPLGYPNTLARCSQSWCLPLFAPSRPTTVYRRCSHHRRRHGSRLRPLTSFYGRAGSPCHAEHVGARRASEELATGETPAGGAHPYSALR
jgi:hypothetical protein